MENVVYCYYLDYGKCNNGKKITVICTCVNSIHPVK